MSVEDGYWQPQVLAHVVVVRPITRRLDAIAEEMRRG